MGSLLTWCAFDDTLLHRAERGTGEEVFLSSPVPFVFLKQLTSGFLWYITLVMVTKVNDVIEVLIHYTKKGPIPLKFTWREIDYDISAINFVHTSHEGNDTIVHFAVSNHQGAYKLEYNSNKLYWKMKEVYTETPEEFTEVFNVSNFKKHNKRGY